MSKVRQLYVEHFNEAEAKAIDNAFQKHFENELQGIHASDDFGTDPFRYKLLTVISYQCVSEYAEHHNIKVSEEDFKEFCLKHADLGEHDGDIPDYLALMAGIYQEYINMEEEHNYE